MKTKRKKGSIGDTEDLPGAAFLTLEATGTLFRLPITLAAVPRLQ